jgi:outer membrane immunogenic protein
MMLCNTKRGSIDITMFLKLKQLSLLCVTTLSITGSSGTLAATTNWSGFYAGINGGYSWSNANTKVIPLPEPAQLPPGDGNIQPSSMSVPMSGGVLGGQIGYNWQIKAYPRAYLSLETDMNWSSLTGSDTGNATGNAVEHFAVYTNVLSTQQQVRWFGTLRGRLGFLSTDSILIYGTGGLAYGSMKEMANVNFVPGGYGDGQYPFSKSFTQIGWVAGGGIEWAAMQNWSVKLEYLYINLGSTSGVANPVVSNPPFQTQYRWSNPAQLIRLGLNYHF